MSADTVLQLVFHYSGYFILVWLHVHALSFLMVAVYDVAFCNTSATISSYGYIIICACVCLVCVG